MTDHPAKPSEGVEVTQADREAAEVFMDAYGWLCEEEWHLLLPNDQEVIARSFAKHRLASTLSGEVERLRAEIINTPETADFMAGVPLEAIHQRERWGSDHDAGKTPYDWFWLVGYLSQKAADAAVRGDTEKAKHHTISTAAALANWHAALTGASTSMRPGVDPSKKVARAELSEEAERLREALGEIMRPYGIYDCFVSQQSSNPLLSEFIETGRKARAALSEAGGE